MKMKKLISLLLAVVMLTGALTVMVGAAGTDSNEPKYSTNTSNGKPQMDYKAGKDNKGNAITTPEQKLALMDYRYGDDKYELYVDAYSGEVAIKSKATGDTLFTNPYNLSQDKYVQATSNKKMAEDLLSQIKVYYTDVKTDISGSLNSYAMSALRNQIVVKNIKGGIRVEYAIGRDESQSLLPHMIEGRAMEEIFAVIETNMEAAIANGTVSKDKAGDERLKLTKLKSFYIEYSLKDEIAINEEMKETYKKNYPILEEFEKLAETDDFYKDISIYVLDTKTMGEQQMKVLETLIKTYHKEFTYQDLQDAHDFVKYEVETENYPYFKMALEYTLEDTGLVVRLPANGIRFDESLFRLDYIEVLPYMGAGKSPNEGYTFFPDGSGTLFNFKEMEDINKEYKGKIYGQDFAYHQPSGMYEEIIRYPVFGIYEKTPVEFDKDGNATAYRDRGFTAIVEEGDALMEIASVHGGRTNQYNTVKMRLYPRPTDSYSLADAISVGSNAEWTVVSARKYTGSYKVRYIMLTDDDVAKTTDEKCYSPSYLGMAQAYRDYLVNNGVLSKLTASDVKEDLPLYIETFGALQTTEKFLSIPVNVMTPLTTFEDITTMYKNLKDNGITNVNFIMKGFTKGGMTSPAVPYNLRWENSVSKEMEFDELLENAKTEGYSLFPDFDFVFSSSDTLFDGLNLNKHAAKTIDDRYTSKREYSATKHTYVSYYELAISPAYFDHFYEKFIPKYAKTSPMGISVSTLGSYLNSDFDEDEPYNRADSKNFTQDAFEYISDSENYDGADVKVMTSGGNAFSWKYVDYITDISLDSSRYALSSAAVPFLGIVLHGYVQTAGTPINMEGNLDYALLKAIENGAALKFILSYRNTEKLKEYETLSKYYSVDYKIWYSEGKGDLITLYHELNELLKDVQTSEIVGHEFIKGNRVPDNDELAADAAQIIKETIEYEKALSNANSEDERLAIFHARQLIVKGNEMLKNSTDGNARDSLQSKIDELELLYKGAINEKMEPICLTSAIEAAEKALEEFKAVQQYHAIYSDYAKNSLGEGYQTEYYVSVAISTYKAYLADKDKAEAERSEKWPEIEKDWDKWQKILGASYIDKLMVMVDAELALAPLEEENTRIEEEKAKAEKEEAEKNEDAEDEEATEDETEGEEVEEEVVLTPEEKERLEKLEAARTAYNTAKEEFEAADNIAGVTPGLLDEIVAAMNNPELNALKEAYIAASEGTDEAAIEAAKEAFEAKIKEIYGNLETPEVEDDGLFAYNVYKISYNGKAVGGSQSYRDYYKNTVYKNAAKAVDDKLNEMYALAEEIEDTQEIYNKVYSSAEIQKAIEYIEEKGAYTTDERKYLSRIGVELDEFVRTDDAYNAIVTYFPTDIFKKAIDSYKKLYDATDAAGVEVKVGEIKDFEISGCKATSYLTSPDYSRVDKNPTVGAEVTEKPVKPVRSEQKYVSDDNMIVHETYANGKEFLLNFNDFSITVVLNNTVYTLEAYGYLVIAPAKKAK